MDANGPSLGGGLPGREHPRAESIGVILGAVPRLSGVELGLLGLRWRDDQLVQTARVRALELDALVLCEMLAAHELTQLLLTSEIARIQITTSWPVLPRPATELLLGAGRATCDALTGEFAREALSEPEYEALTDPWRILLDA